MQAATLDLILAIKILSNMDPPETTVNDIIKKIEEVTKQVDDTTNYFMRTQNQVNTSDSE